MRTLREGLREGKTNAAPLEARKKKLSDIAIHDTPSSSRQYVRIELQSLISFAWGKEKGLEMER